MLRNPKVIGNKTRAMDTSTAIGVVKLAISSDSSGTDKHATSTRNKKSPEIIKLKLKNKKLMFRIDLCF